MGSNPGERREDSFTSGSYLHRVASDDSQFSNFEFTGFPLSLYAPLDVSEFYGRLAEEAATLLGMTHAFLHLDEDSLVIAASHPPAVDEYLSRCATSFADWVIDRGETIMFPPGGSWISHTAVTEVESPFCAIISCPLIVDTQVVGAITIGSTDERSFTSIDSQRLAEFLARASTTMRLIMKQQSGERKACQLEHLVKAIASLSIIQNEGQLLREACSAGIELFGCESAALVIRLEAKSERPKVVTKSLSGIVPPLALSRLRGLARLVEGRTEPLVVSLDPEPERNHQLGFSLNVSEYRSALVVPLPKHVESLGALILASTKRSHFSQTHSLAVSFANQVASFVVNNRVLATERQSQDLKDELLSNITHELKTPLSSIKGYSQLVAKRLRGLSDNRTQEMLATIDSQANEMASMISQIHDLTRIDRGIFDLVLSKWDIIETIKLEVERLSVVSSQHEFVLEMDTESAIGLWDRDRIKRVMANLISNAVKYSPRGGEIRVTVRKKAGHLSISVSDTGIGIDPEHQRKIFKRFYRVQDKGKERYPGMGIGLNLSSEIVKAHGGKMWVESERGKGSTFHFTLPLVGGTRSRVRALARTRSLV